MFAHAQLCKRCDSRWELGMQGSGIGLREQEGVEGGASRDRLVPPFTTVRPRAYGFFPPEFNCDGHSRQSDGVEPAFVTVPAYLAVKGGCVLLTA